MNYVGSRKDGTLLHGVVRRYPAPSPRGVAARVVGEKIAATAQQRAKSPEHSSRVRIIRTRNPQEVIHLRRPLLTEPHNILRNCLNSQIDRVRYADLGTVS